MAEDLEFRRSSTKRRNTEINQIARRLTSNTDKSSQTDLKFSASLFEELSTIIDPETSSMEIIYSVMIKILKSCTNSSWVEFALIDENKLNVCSPTQQQRILDLDENMSLMGYVAIKNSPVLLTNPHTSSFYSRFPVKLDAFSLLTGSVIKPTSIACIPIHVIFK